MGVLERIVRRGDVVVIYCRGQIVLGETDQLRNTALTAIQDTGRLIMNLGEVPYIDSSGLGLMAYLCICARKLSGDVKLVAPSKQVSEVLKTTMLGTVFEVYPTDQAALEAFAAPLRASANPRSRKRYREA